MELLAQDIKSRITSNSQRDEIPVEVDDDAKSFYVLLGEPNSVKFTAKQCSEQDEAVDLSGEVVVIEYNTDSKQPLRTLECEKASLYIEGDKLTPTLTMDIDNAKEAGSVELMMRYIIRGLLPPEVVEVMANEFKTESGSLKTEKLASGLSELAGFKPSPRLAKLQGQLQRTIQKTFVEIKAEIHSRLVFGAGCVPMILIGIGLGIIKKGGHLLSAFGASCVPAAVLIVCIMSGKQVIENLSAQTVSGVAIMWAGLGFLFFLAVVIYGLLLKN
jgi:hypothetical protein